MMKIILSRVTRTAAASLLSFAAFTGMSSADEANKPPADIITELPPGTSASWWYEVQQNIAAMEYEISPISEEDAQTTNVAARRSQSLAGRPNRAPSAAHRPESAQGYSAPNRAQRFRTNFTDIGIHLQPRTGDEEPWELTLETRRMGRGQAGAGTAGQRAPGTGKAASGQTHLRQLGRAFNMRAEASRIAMDRDGLVEWFENTPRGLKQNFEIATPPEGDGPLVVEYGVFGDLLPIVTEDGQEVAFANEYGVATVFMEGLVVFDANKTLLEARFEYDTAAATLSILVDDTNASYPVTIDPLITRNRWQINFNTSQFEWSVQQAGSAGDVNGDGYSDFYIAQPGYQDELGNTVGRIMVFYGSPTGPGSTPNWVDVGTIPAAPGRGLGAYGAVALRAPRSDEDPGAPAIDRYDGLAVLVPTQTGECGDSVPCALSTVRIYLGGPGGLPVPGSTERIRNVTEPNVSFRSLASDDFDRDGYSDLVLGAVGENGNDKLFVLNGLDDELMEIPVLLYDEIAPNGRAVPVGAGLGISIATPGDFNGNGYPDLVVGTPYPNLTQYRGRAYLLEGSANGLTGNARFLMDGRYDGDEFPSRLDVGDFNGDGLLDILASNSIDKDVKFIRIIYRPTEPLTIRTSPPEDYSGAGDYPMALVDSQDMSEGKKRRDLLLGAANAANAGDTNGNGIDDILRSTHPDDTMLTTGKRTSDPSITGSLEDGGFYPPGISLKTMRFVEGTVQGSAGDVNGDGFDDFLVKTQTLGYDYVNRGITLHYGGVGDGGLGADWELYNTGSFVNLGDVNGDGLDDVCFSISGGKAYIFLGHPTGLGTIPDWQIDLTKNYINNDTLPALSVSPASAGDLNGDGYNDLVVKVFGERYDGEMIAAVLVYYGGPEGFLSDGAQTKGSFANANWIWETIVPVDDTEAAFGISSRIIGNVNPSDPNCPSCDDLAIVRKYRPSPGMDFDTELLVFYGREVNLDASSTLGGGFNVPLASHTDANWRWQPTLAGGPTGGAIVDVVAAGDINGNGIDDILVLTELLPESPGFTNYAGLYGIFGASAGLPTNVSKINPLESGSFRWLHQESDTIKIVGVASGADVNNDGYNDIIITEKRHEAKFLNIFYGRPDFINGPAPNGVYEWEWWGGSFVSDVKSILGDFNGDGFADIVVAVAPIDEVAIFPGGPSGPAPSPSWSARFLDLYPFGIFVSPMLETGDYNGDGYSDLIIGGIASDNTPIGLTILAYLFYGPIQGPSGAPQWVGEGEALGDQFGFSVAGIGDINGDGYDDIIVGAPGFDLNFINRGAAFVYPGSATGLSSTPLDTGDLLRGKSDNELFGRAVYKVGDLNGDGRIEFGITSTTGISDKLNLFSGPGSATGFTEYATESLTSNMHLHDNGVAVGDFDGDGDIDIAIRYNYTASALNGGIRVFRNENGQFLFSKFIAALPIYFEAIGEYAQQIVAVDMNGNSIDDIVVSRNDFAIGSSSIWYTQLLLAKGGADFWERPVLESTDVVYQRTTTIFSGASVLPASAITVLGDINGDGFQGFAYLSSGWGGVFYGHTNFPINELIGALPNVTIPENILHIGAPGDVNADGFDDLAMTVRNHDGTTSVEVHHGWEYASLAFHLSKPTWRIRSGSSSLGGGDSNVNWQWAGLGDVNGDRINDFALHHGGGANTHGQVLAFYGGPPLPSATVRRWAMDGDVPPLDFGRVVRATLDYSSGTNPIDSEQIPESITYFRSGPAQVPAGQTFELLPIRWYLDTGRMNFTADLTLEYTDFELGEIDESRIEVFTYSSEEDPLWQRAGTSQTLRAGQNSITVHGLQQGGFFVIGILTNSAPVAGTVLMKTGDENQAPPFDITPESLEIEWFGFTDDVGIVSYEVALVRIEGSDNIESCVNDPESCFVWRNVGLVDNFTLNANDPEVDPSMVVQTNGDWEFRLGTYYFFVRAIDEEGARSQFRLSPPPPLGVVLIVVTDRPTLGFGQAIPIPEGVVPCTDLDPCWEPLEGAVFISAPIPGTNAPAGLFATQDTRKFVDTQDLDDLLWIDWNRDGIREPDELYFVSDDPDVAAHTPMRIYHTDRPDGGRYPSPPVNLDNVDIVTVHFNDRVQYQDPEGKPAGFTQDLWVDPTNRELRARQSENPSRSPNRGMVLLHFERLTATGSQFVGTQIVDVRAYAPDFVSEPDQDNVPVFDIGDQLLPAGSPYQFAQLDEYLVAPVVARGGTGAGSGDYLYQHQVPGADSFGNLYAIRKTTSPTFRDAEVFWMRTVEQDPEDDSFEGRSRSRVAQIGLEWPYAMGRYNFDWPDPEALKVQRYIRHYLPDSAGKWPDNAGVAVQLDGTLNPTVMPYLDDLLPFEITDEPSTGRFSTARKAGALNRGGWLLFRYRPGNEVLFQVVQCVDRTVAGQVFESLPKSVGVEIDGREDENIITEQAKAKLRRTLLKDEDGEFIRDENGELVEKRLVRIDKETPGYIHVRAGLSTLEDRYDWEIYDGDNGVDPVNPLDVTGQIIGVNEGALEVWWYQKDVAGTPWPANLQRYQVSWPSSPPFIEIASGVGTGVLAVGTRMYFQNDPERPGYNPNEEHALLLPPFGEGFGRIAAFALRDDFNTSSTSEPYVLLKRKNADGKWRYDGVRSTSNASGVIKVERGDLTYKVSVGDLLDPPYPLSRYETFPYVGRYPSYNGETPFEPDPDTTVITGTYGVPRSEEGGWHWQDRNGRHWARANGDMKLRFYYRIPTGFNFFTPEHVEITPEGRVRWLSSSTTANEPKEPIEVTFKAEWPPSPVLRFEDVLVKPKEAYGVKYTEETAVGDLPPPGLQIPANVNTLPGIEGQVSVEMIYHEAAEYDPAGRSAMLIDYKRARSVPLSVIPEGIETQIVQGKRYFIDLPPGLRERLYFDNISNELAFQGIFVEPTSAPATYPYYILPNIMTENDKAVITGLLQPGDPSYGDWAGFIEQLYGATKLPHEVKGSSIDYSGLALTTGNADEAGYITLALQDNEAADPLPVSVQVVYISEKLQPGAIAVIEPLSPFDEKLTVRHENDYLGKPEEFYFDWYFARDSTGTDPRDGSGNRLLPRDEAGNLQPPWERVQFYKHGTDFAVDDSAKGANELLIDARLGAFALRDHWFVMRYKRGASGEFSDFTPAALGEGWIKRVVGRINPFTQRAEGGGIDGAEDRFTSFGERDINTIVSMISQAGPRYTGDIPMNSQQNLDELGLIQIYQTVLNRGRALSIDASPPLAADFGGNEEAAKKQDPREDPDVNNALLLAAGRIADLYQLLGNEAYADAADPTIGFGTDDGEYGSEASSIFSFMNQVPTLLDEELALLRGRDDTLSPPVTTVPFYNRLVWNFTRDLNGGEVAYALNYNIQDQANNGMVDGTIDVEDAKALYPQGHGDAWGHYLYALKSYYRLLQNGNFTWSPRAEAVNVGASPVTVDYLDERKFARAAAAKARTGAEVVNLTYRKAYVDNPATRWQGYDDDLVDGVRGPRRWGVSDWSMRAGTGAYFDWLTANAILPAEDDGPNNQGVQKIDRSTVLAIADIATAFETVQTQSDMANQGLSPLGLAADVVPFGISPAGIDQGQTHFEQVYQRAVTATSNALTVFNYANNSTQRLRRQSDSIADFQRAIRDRENDFKNRMIEVFGYPYGDDIGPTGTYPEGYDGPDIYNYMLADPSEFTGQPAVPDQSFTITFQEVVINDRGEISTTPKPVTYLVDSDGFGIVKPGTWTKSRRAPGEIQLAQKDLLQARGRFQRALSEYDILIDQIERQAQLLEAQYNLSSNELMVLNRTLQSQQSLNSQILALRGLQSALRQASSIANVFASAIAEFLPTSVGLATDVTAPARGAIRLTGATLSDVLSLAAEGASLIEFSRQQTKEDVSALSNIEVTTLRNEFALQQAVAQLTQLVRAEVGARYEVYTLVESLQQASGRYQAAVARGLRLQDDLLRFRQETAGQVQSQRFRDMAFRVFRDDALQKYRAQFDLASRYVYMAAKAYDYETGLLGTENASGRRFLQDIVRARSIGIVQNGVPLTDDANPTLADALARMYLNFDLVLRPQLGFNNPQTETNRFSVRSELFRIAPGSAGDAAWVERLANHYVPNVLDIPEVRRYCQLPQPLNAVEPGIVIPFSTNIHQGLNYFGWPLGGGDSAYDSSNFATKVRSVGVWFSNYNNLSEQLGGLSNTPRVYLVPVGRDILRAPSFSTPEIRQFRVVDQLLPVPFPLSTSSLSSETYIPAIDGQSGAFEAIRRYPSFRAYHDSGMFSPSELASDSRLVGRSVWNTRWLLVIPGWTLNADREEGLKRFIYGAAGPTGPGKGVTDIKYFFETYAYSGAVLNKSTESEESIEMESGE